MIIQDLKPALRCLALLGCDAPEGAIRAAWFEATVDGDFASIRRLAARVGLVGTLARFVGRLPREAAGPDFYSLVADGLRAEARSDAALRIVRVLDAAMSPGDPPAVLVKGAALLSAGLYESGERDFVDADLVIPPDSAERFAGLLRDAGVRYEPYSRPNYEVGVATDGGRGAVEIHVALAGDAGGEAGPSYDTVASRSSAADPASGLRNIRVLRGQAARELAAHHFVAHHAGAPENALRSLQDLSRLEGDDEEAVQGLPWRRAEHVRALTSGLREVAAELRSGAVAEGGRAAAYLERLSEALAIPYNGDEAFASEVDRWVALHSGWWNRTRFVAGRMFAAGPGAGLVDRGVRPVRLAARWTAGRFSRFKSTDRARASSRWTAFLKYGLVHEY